MMHVFATAFGHVGVDFSDLGLTRVRFLTEPVPSTEPSPPRFVREGARAIERHFSGSPQDLRAVPVDLRKLPPFRKAVYEAAREVLAGRTVGYGDLAAKAGSPGGARAVGQAMAHNPLMLVVPCHRVLASGDKVGGFTAPGGVVTKERMLALEGVFLGLPRPVLAYDGAEAVRHLRAQDPALTPLLDRVPFRVELSPALSLFDALGRSIVYQQLSGKAAGTIHARYRMLFPMGRPTPEGLRELGDAQLRGCGLSENKAKAVRDLGARIERGDVPELDALRAMDDESIIKALTGVRGIGRWTVQMLLMFRLGRPDVLPVDDLGVRKGFQITYRTRALPTPARMERHAERWAPYRSVGSWYMWRATEQ